MHLHHILPKHAGGTDDESNLFPLSPTQHALAHRNRWILTGDVRDRIAWLGLAGIKDSGECQILAVKKSNTGRKHTDEERAKMSANRAGKVGWLKKGDKFPLMLGNKNALKEHSEETRKKMSETKKRLGVVPPQGRWITDGLIEKRLQGELPVGFRFGRK